MIWARLRRFRIWATVPCRANRGKTRLGLGTGNLSDVCSDSESESRADDPAGVLSLPQAVRRRVTGRVDMIH